MTEKSWGWTTGTTNDGASTYTQSDYAEQFKVVAACRAFEGVAPGYLNNLVVSGVASPVSINTGGAMVDGHPYKNDVAVTVVIPTPVTYSRIDRIVLRADWANHTVRVTRIAGTEAASPTAPAITQTPGTTYDIMLAQVRITTGGAITVTDERVVASPLKGRQGGNASDWSVNGSLNYIPDGYKVYVGSKISNGSGSGQITFPAAFSAPPLVFLSVVYSGSTNAVLYTPLTTAVNFDTVNPATGAFVPNVVVDWLAIGPA